MAQPPADWLVKIDSPVRDEVLPAEYVTAREINALAEPGDLAAVCRWPGQRRFALALMGRRRDALWRPHAGLKALRFGPPRIA
jgi:hypothetical protein